jgi:hypothetical protein
MEWLVLKARPRVAPLGWPHTIQRALNFNRGISIDYDWVYVKPDGSGWTTSYDDSLCFPERKLDDVLEGFYSGAAGPYPFDFEVTVTEQPAKNRAKAPLKSRWVRKRLSGKNLKRQPVKTARAKKTTKARKSKKPAVRKRTRKG